MGNSTIFSNVSLVDYIRLLSSSSLATKGTVNTWVKISVPEGQYFLGVCLIWLAFVSVLGFGLICICSLASCESEPPVVGSVSQWSDETGSDASEEGGLSRESLPSYVSLSEETRLWLISEPSH